MQKLVILLIATCLLSGCSGLHRMMGQTNDTVLPGQREEILAPGQQTAQDPNVVGQPGAPATVAGNPPANGAVTQTQIMPPAGQSKTAMAPQGNAPLALAKSKGQETIVDCDPKVDLCPEPMAPEPLPPPSPIKVEKPAKGAKVADAAAAGQVLDANGKPVDGKALKKVVKKKKLKKKVVKPVAPATPAAPDAATPVPAPPSPQGQ